MSPLRRPPQRPKNLQIGENAMPLLLKIVTPIGIALERSVESVVLPAADGEIEILPGHLPLVTIIQPGELVAKVDGPREYFAIDAGFAMVIRDSVLVLTDESLNINDDDLAEIEKAEERAKRALEDARSRREAMDPEEIRKLDAKVKYQMARKLAKMQH
ncbi:MAG: ATP synthase F1 subunit epsilon [Puniceicoccales bacterium]|jgi:F-type H+-transporting ATPase subunit epsilon|nr:ATP synthase F1 subunit epsilon [Puniceicoccales bacterium]